MYILLGIFETFLVIWLIARKASQPDFGEDEQELKDQRQREDLVLMIRIAFNMIILIAFTLVYLLCRRWHWVTELLAPFMVLFLMGASIYSFITF